MSTSRFVLGSETEDLARLLEGQPELHALLERERSKWDHERGAWDRDRAALTNHITSLEQERDRLRASHERLRQELELFKRRLFIAKAERVDTRQLELEYAEKLRERDRIAGTLGLAKEPLPPRTILRRAMASGAASARAIEGRAARPAPAAPRGGAHRDP